MRTAASCSRLESVSQTATLLVVLPGIAIAVFSISLFISACAVAAPADFVRDVRPIFEKHCTECHGEKKQKSGFRLDVKAAALKGGDNHGPDILPGKAKDSPLIHFLNTDDEDELMPP